ncbi:hypothetical protein [Streptomyces antimycoticus]|uniref:hypothetical protein n=1 Tax=Streptomyces antimycoticus TaxID=68175 RepID=UPI000A3ADBF5|nr:hypothetical protein [Streptomyces antimycoticus]
MTTITRRGLYERVASLFGRRIAYDSTTAVNERLGQQTAAAYSLQTWHQQQATVRNTSALAVQPGLLDARDRILTEALFLEGHLAGARANGLRRELIEALERAVDHSHELAGLLATAARTTTEPEITGR